MSDKASKANEARVIPGFWQNQLVIERWSRTLERHGFRVIEEAIDVCQVHDVRSQELKSKAAPASAF